MTRKEKAVAKLSEAIEALGKAKVMIEAQDDELQAMQEDEAYEAFDADMNAACADLVKVEDLLSEAGEQYFEMSVENEGCRYRIGCLAAGPKRNIRTKNETRS